MMSRLMVLAKIFTLQRNDDVLTLSGDLIYTIYEPTLCLVLATYIIVTFIRCTFVFESVTQSLFR